jgi:hypothetical protein
MEIANERRTGPKRIGELLVAANVIKPEVVLDALTEAQASGRQIGRVLMSRGVLRERDLDSAIEVQSFLRDGLISYEFGVRALNLAAKSNMPMSQAFSKLGWTPPQEAQLPVNELADLLLAANVASRKTIEEALRQSNQTNIPLGKCLVSARAISQTMLSSALTARVLMRDGKINKEQAISGLKASHHKHQSLEQSLEETGALVEEVPNIKVGDLLSSAGLVTEQDKNAAVEMGLTKDQQVGQILIEQGAISLTVLDEGLLLQKMVQTEQITPQQATAILRDAHARGIKVEDVLTELYAQYEEEERLNKSFVLLVEAGLLHQDNLNKAQTVSVQMEASVAEVLITNEILPKEIIMAASQAQSLIDEQIIGKDQAIAVLVHCQETGDDFHTALEATPWEKKAVAQEEPEKEGKKPWLGGFWSKRKKKED